MVTILDALRDQKLFAPFFNADDWRAWFAFLAALFELPMDAAALDLYRRCTGRRAPPVAPTREAWVIAGRRGGKSRIAALLAVYAACFRTYTDVLAPGEVAMVAIIAADRRQARTILRHVNGFFDAVPMLNKMVSSRTKETLTLANRVVIEVHTASWRTLRGYTIVAAICDELAFWHTDESGANPDTEILAALRPAMLSVPSALLLCISSPYSRKGALWEAYRRHFGQADSTVLVWQAPTALMNPRVDREAIAGAYAEDPAAAAAEFGAEFRSDIEAFLTHELIRAVTVPGREALPPTRHRYFAFTDPAGGTGADAMTLASGHVEWPEVLPAPTGAGPFAAFGPTVPTSTAGAHTIVIDQLVERRPPFSPTDAVREFAALLHAYGVTTVVGDRYAGDWPADRFAEHGIDYAKAPGVKGELYLQLLPAITAREIELPDHQRLHRQLVALERRTSRVGRDLVDHPPRGHDDLANAVAGLVAVARVDARGAGWSIEEAYGV
jgi:terminase large subunit-like protein